MKGILRKGLSLCITACMLFSVSVFAEDYSFENFQKYRNSEDIQNDEKLKETTVYIVGDSTACEYGYDENYAVPRAGWGMYLSKYLKSEAKVVNLALAGRSSKSFTTEENYIKLFEDIEEGDFLLIQFGHNDAKNKTEEDLRTRYTDPQGDKDTEGSFKNSLYVNYILPAREKGAVPVLISPVSRRKFDAEGKVTDSHGFYDDAVRELAEETEVPFVDMTEITAEIYNDNVFPDKITKTYHAVYKDYSKGIDNTHYSHTGAEFMAVEFIMAIDNPLSEYRINLDDLRRKVAEEFFSVSRGDFIALLMRAVGIEGEAKDNFADVDKNADYANAVGLAKEAGIAFGDDFGNFNPEDKLKNYELPLFTMRTLRYLDFKKPKSIFPPIEGPIEYDDMNLYFQELVEQLPKYAIEDFEEWSSLKDDYYNYLGDRPLDRFEVQRCVVTVYELLTENVQREEQSVGDLEKVENTK